MADEQPTTNDRPHGLRDIEQGLGLLTSVIDLIEGLDSERIDPTTSAILCMVQKAGGVIERGAGAIVGKPIGIAGTVEDWMTEWTPPAETPGLA